jgi:RNA polymerase sigma-70 factor (ECF subfamily)
LDKEKFINVIRENQKLIYKICRTYCRKEENRKDLEQEILVQLWKSIGKYDGRAKISTWIYRVALNTAISYFRDDMKYNGKKAGFDVSAISLPVTEYDPESERNIERLYLFINMLDELDKALILLYLDENKYKEIADILGISETNVATKINRIKKVLKEKFGNI